MKQIYEHYEKWEDYRAGMFSLSTVSDDKILLSRDLLSNANKFYNTLLNVLVDWQVSAAVNLTNKGQNRRAWLGAAACMYKHSAPEYITRIAWGLLDYRTQKMANAIAEKIIVLYERQNTGLYQNVGTQMLF